VTSLAALIPVLDRPQNVAPIVASLYESVAVERAEGWDVSLVFVCTPGDHAEIAAVRAHGHELIVTPFSGRDFGQYAKKTNLAVAATHTEFVFTGADDLAFRPGWLTEALRVHEDTGCLVIGTNDCANPTVTSGRHATHSLVHRSYVELGTIDDPTKLLHEGYDHNSVDCEFVETAQARGEFAHAALSVVAHLHPTFNRSVARDATYRKGLKNARKDKALFHARRHLWGADTPRSFGRRTRSRAIG
jgi:hypothetical protein